MRKVDVPIIKNLIAYEGEPVLTLYIPTNRYPTPPNIQEDQTRFKNLVHDGFERWCEQIDSHAVKVLQEQLEGLLDDLNFWQETLETLTVFAKKDSVEIYHLPIETEERVYVGPCFDVAPLLLIESMNQPCYVFALAMHQPKLYKADLYGLEQVDIEFPKSPEDALHIDEMFSGSQTMKGGRSTGSSSMASSPHGQGDSNNAGSEERMSYLRMLDEQIRDMKDFDDTLPFIIAATDTEFGDFRATSRIKSIINAHIPGNHTETPPQDLHHMVVMLLNEKIVRPRQDQVVERLSELLGMQKASTEIADVAVAASDGRVDTLLLPMIEMTTDSVSDTETHKPLVRFSSEYDEVLFNIATDVVRQGGTVTAVQRDSLPGKASLGALYRH